MTDEQIMQALKCCTFDSNCGDCPYCGHDCFSLEQDALALIIRQKEEIERLTVERDTLRGEVPPAGMRYNALRAEQAVAAATRAATARRVIETVKKRSSRCVAVHDGKEIYSTMQYTISATSLDDILMECTEGKTNAEIH